MNGNVSGERGVHQIYIVAGVSAYSAPALCEAARVRTGTAPRVV